VAGLHSVLVIRLSSLGDVLFALPAVQALLASGLAERVSWLVEDRAAGLLRSVEGLHEVVVFPRRSKRRWPAHLRRLRARRDDLVIDLQGNFKSRAHLAFLRAPRKLGYDAPLAREGAEKALTERFAPGPRVRHRVASHAALVRHLGVDVPLHFSAFHPDYKMRDLPRTPPSTLQRARRIAMANGLRYVYVGNVHDREADSTWCHACGELLIERDWYRLGRYRLEDGCCPGCGERVPGRFEAGPGSWGPRRQPVRLAEFR